MQGLMLMAISRSMLGLAFAVLNVRQAWMIATGLFN